ncbi:MAG TPA: hypothetical protein VE291_02450 [Terracidiphilus sp.]|nr:hypothetical protein [Terracidiphilus sp.]
MPCTNRVPKQARLSWACWNWKCALMSATVRSLVYLGAEAGHGFHARPGGGLFIVGVEMAYVTATAGLYAGLQQRALALRPRLLGNLCIVAGVPGLAQFLDWLAHRAVGPAAPARALAAVCVFTLISALFHLHVMRRGVFLTGSAGRSFADDLRRIPHLLAGFVRVPAALLAGLAATESEPAL